jgi:3-dehydroquinate dehydratase-2
MNFQVKIIHGPNLNLLGQREKSIYGDTQFEDYLHQLKVEFPQCDIDYFQSNSEGDIVSYIQNINPEKSGIIINPAAFTHTSIAIRDALLAVKIPCIEVHLSDIYQREKFRHHSYIKDICICSIFGQGMKGYAIALTRLTELLESFNS